MKRKDKNIQTRDGDKKRQTNTIINQDRLSSLPDSLLVSILSLLSVEEAVTTSVLSRRWRYLWTQISHVQLSYYFICRRRADDREAAATLISAFVSTIDHIFQQLTCSKLDSIDLHFPNGVEDDTQIRFEDWARRSCVLHVEEFSVRRYGGGFIRFPSCMLQCQSLVVLRVDGGGFCFKLPDNNGIINLPNLKKMELTYISEWDTQTMSSLLKSCPLLEELDLQFSFKVDGALVDISCRKLRSLRIRDNFKMGWKYVIDAPRLESIGINSSETTSLRLLEIPFSLNKAKIKLKESTSGGGGGGGENDHDHGQLSEVVHWICSAKSLELSSIVLYPLVHLVDGALPCYSNLALLQIYMSGTSACNNLLRYLNCAPNLEGLVIEMELGQKGVKWGEPDSFPVPACFSSKLKKIEVKNFEGSKEEFKFLKYILGNANALECLLVGVNSCSRGQLSKEARFCKSLFRLHRSSTACVIDFRSTFLHASSINTDSSTTLDCQIQRL